jgi:hypothetical protein
MTLPRITLINAVAWIGLGIAFTLYAPLTMAFFRIPDISNGSVLMYWNVASFIRLYGATMLSLGLLLLAVRSLLLIPGIPAAQQRGVLSALILGNLIALIVAIVQQFSVWNQAAGWTLIVLYLVILALYIGVWFSQKNK